MIRNTRYAALLIVTAFLFRPSFAQNLNAEKLKSNSPKSTVQPTQEDSPDDDLRAIGEEAPPPAEAPYPGSSTEDTAPPPQKAPAKKYQATAPTPKPPQAATRLPKPKAIDEDGNYYYGVSEESDEKDVKDMKVPPSTTVKAPQAPSHLDRPLEVRANGDYFYGYEVTPHNRSASIKFGYFEPPQIVNPVSHLAFSDLYSNTIVPTFLVDYEFQLNGKLGGLGVRLGTGLFSATGHGTFADAATDTDRVPTYTPGTTFTFLMLPNTVTGLYHFRYAEKQWIAPYVGAGAGYFIFSEIRDDGGAPKFGGAATALATGGLNFLIDNLDPKATRELDNNYGISHVWFSLEFTQIIGLNPNYDFTSSVVNGGLTMEF